MADERMFELLSRLLDLTEKGRISWQETSRTGVFQTAFSSYSVQIQEYFDQEVEREFTILELYNQEGKIVDGISTGELSSVHPEVSGNLYALFKEARRNARGLEDALNSVLGDLEELEGDEKPRR